MVTESASGRYGRGLRSFTRYAGIETFRVHTDCFVILRSSELGVLEAQLFEDALERGGGYKVFRYYDTRPERRVDG